MDKLITAIVILVMFYAGYKVADLRNWFIITPPSKPELSMAVTTVVGDVGKSNYSVKRDVYIKDSICNTIRDCMKQCILPDEFVSPPDLIEVQVICTIIDPVKDVSYTIQKICCPSNKECIYHESKQQGGLSHD